jgi:two-component system nitrogen regulation response regulator NtrX
MARILVIDDEANIRASLKSSLERRGHDIVTAANLAEGREFYSGAFDLILLDVMLPDGNGIDLLREIKQRDPSQSVLMISGHADIQTAVSAIKLGAYDFIEKPLSLDRLLVTIQNAKRARLLSEEKQRLSWRVYGELIGESAVIKKLRQDVAVSAPKTDRFLILGENGTGKELVAHMIHSLARNADGPFIAVNCAALPRELVESELFGHTKGAFTGATRERKGRFQEAEGGTIFLDEIGDMPMEAQAKILRTLETRTVSPVGADKEQSVNVVVVAASNRDLSRLVTEGKFRQDLLYRLNVVSYYLPPLHDRPEDIPLLASHFLRRFAEDAGTVIKQLSNEAVALLRSHPFPGNVREFKNLMERLNIYIDSPEIRADHLRSLLPESAAAPEGSLKEAVDNFERNHILKTLHSNRGNVAQTARQLRLERSHLYKKMKRHGLD